jgi:hypothetical protein
MNAQLLAEVQAWIVDDPDPKTAAELTKLVAAGDETYFKESTLQGFSNSVPLVYVAQLALVLHV